MRDSKRKKKKPPKRLKENSRQASEKELLQASKSSLQKPSKTLFCFFFSRTRIDRTGALRAWPLGEKSGKRATRSTHVMHPILLFLVFLISSTCLYCEIKKNCCQVSALELKFGTLNAAAAAQQQQEQRRQANSIVAGKVARIYPSSIPAGFAKSRLHHQQQLPVPASEQTEQESQTARKQLQVSITPRLPLMRVPVDSNAILKCLVSVSSAERFSRPFDIHWSRYMYDEGVYEQIESFPALDVPNSSALLPIVRRSVLQSSSIKKKRHHHLQLPPLADTGSPEDTTNSNNDDGFLVISGELQEQQQQTFDRQQQLRDFLSRSRQETNSISELLIEATLSINPVKASDNASYYCTATSSQQQDNSPAETVQQARIDLIALSKPVVQLLRFQAARDSRSALVIWRVVSNGNTPITKTILMIRNETTATTATAAAAGPFDSFSGTPEGALLVESDRRQWQRIDLLDEGPTLESALSRISGTGAHLYRSSQLYTDAQDERRNQSQATSSESIDGSGDPYHLMADMDITSSGPLSSSYAAAEQARGSLIKSSRFGWSRKLRAYNLTNLLPGVTYQLKLAAINDMGQSEWSQLSAFMRSHLPAKISQVYLLSSSNDSIAIGWRRPSYDQAKTIRYEMQLFDLNRTLTLDANTNTSASSKGTNFMYIFFNLNPGTDYHFQVRACSRAGCGPFSTPRLAASTQDGEPDEPLDVELVCKPAGNVSVTWLPPLNPRGQLTNYSLSFESSARYLNSSGRWQTDQWRHSLDTPDNHTLSVEAPGLLTPNTNYSVRVCANNRSRHCGRLSALSPQTQCTSPPELPSWPHWSAQVKLSVEGVSDSGPRTSPNSPVKGQLSLELPFISQRNGTIHCIQLILIALPESFKLNQSSSSSSSSALHQILPAKPADIEFHLAASSSATTTTIFNSSDSSPIQADETGKQQTVTTATVPSINEEKLFVYLAEQIQFPQATSDSTLASQQEPNGKLNLLLGDGVRAGERCKVSNEEFQLKLDKAHSKAYDRALKPLTYYTGFLKLIMLRPQVLKKQQQLNNQEINSQNAFASSMLASNGDELLMSYSDYLNPVRTGDSVLEAQEPGEDQDEFAYYLKFVHPFRGLNSKMGVSEMVDKISSNIRSNVVHLYSISSTYLTENVRLSRVSDFIMQSSPMMQLLEVGFIVFVLSLILLLLVYLISLPMSSKRKRKRKVNRQLQKHQEAALKQQSSAEASYLSSETHCQSAGNLIADHDPYSNSLKCSQQQQQSDLQALAGSVGYRQLPNSIEEKSPSDPNLSPVQSTAAVPATYIPHAHQCHIHSSPQQQQQQTGHVHQVQPQQAEAVLVQQQQLAYTDHELTGRQDHWQERNCKTLRRPTSNKLDLQQQQQQQAHQQLAAHNELTMGSQMNSVLAFAKKINKSIPLRLFSLVLECRLRNGWLREEYEQLARQQQYNSLSTEGKLPKGDLLIKLRPQLIVSRVDEPNVSALISGNEEIDASLIKLAPSGGGQERKFICARSPLDADAVWDFWRLVYEQEVGVIVMLSQNEDPHTNELRCAQYWPTCDNEETTILSPCNEYVQKSNIRPAKFKIRQETLQLNDDSSVHDEEFKIRRLTLLVMATKTSENETPPVQSLDRESTDNLVKDQQDLIRSDQVITSGADVENKERNGAAPMTDVKGNEEEDDEEDEEDDEESLLIVERTVIHLQYLYWNTSTQANQHRLIKFIEIANERYLQSGEQEKEDGSPFVHHHSYSNSPMLVHCFNGLGRTGLFTAMSFVIDELARKMATEREASDRLNRAQQTEMLTMMMMMSNQPVAKINLFQLVNKLRAQRESLLSPYRFYELLYQLTAIYSIPSQEPLMLTLTNHKHNHNHHRRNHFQHHHHHPHHHNHPQAPALQSHPHPHLQHHQQQQQPNQMRIQQQQQMIAR